MSFGLCGEGTTQWTGEPMRSSVSLPRRRSYVRTKPSVEELISSGREEDRDKEVMELVASLSVWIGSRATALASVTDAEWWDSPHIPDHDLCVKASCAGSAGKRVTHRDGSHSPLARICESLLKATALIFPKCPCSRRITCPDATSHTNTSLSPPHDANLALSCDLQCPSSATTLLFRRILWKLKNSRTCPEQVLPARDRYKT